MERPMTDEEFLRIVDALKGSRNGPISLGARIVSEERLEAMGHTLLKVRWVERKGGIDAVVHAAMTEDILRKVYGAEAEQMLRDWLAAHAICL
ncbi:hypothetical protein GPECTOR_50g624 [Gonium pectorale]|uniref:Uncharacterized protein n=1 Tax=Gonium pectorale TaxID=33097 RepID=A0A150G8Z2_GONPE|nr:hypothetical protein GPECTOR_50g624 [Gonium pectorale]|eukprot:KXZ45830.1 hypothetical protein GPECTOR_50g624 [Gonium pectorale]